jgi:hypothetical protein
MSLALTADTLKDEGLKPLSGLADAFALKYPASRRKS